MCNEIYDQIHKGDSQQRVNLINQLTEIVEDMQSVHMQLRQRMQPLLREKVITELRELTRRANQLRNQIARTK